jgi:hypothetical protein
MLLNYLAFQAFNLERSWWRLFQKRVMCTKCYIYLLIIGWFCQVLFFQICRIRNWFNTK